MYDIGIKFDMIGLTIIKYHDKALILPEFLFMKTVREDEITHCGYIIIKTWLGYRLRNFLHFFYLLTSLMTYFGQLDE